VDYGQNLTQENRLNDQNPRKKKEKQRHLTFDVPFFLLTLTLTVIGIIMMFSASYARAFQEEGNSTYYLGRQAIFAVLGLILMLVVAFYDYQHLRKWAFVAYIGSLILMILVPIIGVSEGGAKRWINLGFTAFQPSELVKMSIVLTYATLISAFGEKMKQFKYGVLYLGLLLIPFVVLLLLQPHLSATIIICATAAAMMFQGGTKMRWFVLLGLVGVAGFIFLTSSGYTARRLAAWRDPFSDPSDAGYQVVQSLYAIGSGGLFGLGFGKSRQKYLYLPEEHNDYIFPIVCEELGFVGAALIILLFVLLIIRGYWIAMHAKDRMGALLAGGFTTLLALQVFLNIGVVTNFLPATGISLPFFSYGGTALVMQLVQMGIVLSVSRYSDNNLL